MHCYWHTPKPICANYQAFSSTFSLFKLMFFFFIFCQGELSKKPKICTFCWFWLGKMHWNGSSVACLEFEACWIQWHAGFESLCDKWFIEKSQFQAKISHYVDLDWDKMHWNGLSVACLRVWGMLNLMAQVLSLYDKQLPEKSKF